MKFNFTNEQLQQMQALATVNEIYQQPGCWDEVLSLLSHHHKKIATFYSLIANQNVKYIFTGSGTSAFIGASLADYFCGQNINVTSISATDIVSNPTAYFHRDQATVLISFARSGDSPESVATVNLANSLITNCYHIIITCNKDGSLYQKCHNDNRALVLLLPPQTNDKSFAMTSSYSSMLVTALVLLSTNYQEIRKQVQAASNNVRTLLTSSFLPMQTIANLKHERIVFLGANTLKGYSQESALKTLELTAGQVVTMFDSCLGFRHGPKSIVNQETMVFIYLSANEYSRKYDIDLLKELFTDNIAKTIVVCDNMVDKTIIPYCHYYFATSTNNNISSDIVLGLQYVVLAQIYALFKSLFFTNTPDNPCATGTVNRVVKGVKIYPLLTTK